MPDVVRLPRVGIRGLLAAWPELLARLRGTGAARPVRDDRGLRAAERRGSRRRRRGRRDRPRVPAGGLLREVLPAAVQRRSGLPAHVRCAERVRSRDGDLPARDMHGGLVRVGLRLRAHRRLLPEAVHGRRGLLGHVRERRLRERAGTLRRPAAAAAVTAVPIRAGWSAGSHEAPRARRARRPSGAPDREAGRASTVEAHSAARASSSRSSATDASTSPQCSTSYLASDVDNVRRGFTASARYVTPMRYSRPLGTSSPVPVGNVSGPSTHGSLSRPRA